jgi:4'-phosphopantetheinyl transferase
MQRYLSDFVGQGVDLWFSSSLGEVGPRVSEGCFARILPFYPRSRGLFRRGQFGQPQADGLFLTLSHSRHLALAAIATRRIGVDVEYVREGLNLASLAAECLSVRELATFMRLKPSDQIRSFFKIWTQKEALSKALGLGLRVPFNELEVEADPNVEPRVLSMGGYGQANNWSLFSCPLPDEMQRLTAPAFATIAVEVEPTS